MSAARKKRRRYRRRGRFGFLYKMLAVIAVLMAVVMGAAVFFRVEEVVVAGNFRYTARQVINASEVQQGDNLFGLNEFAVARQIRRRLPYVEAVNIRRGWPDTLIITVAECRAVAQLPGAQSGWLISTAGKVLEQVGGETASVIPVEGLEVIQPEAGSRLVVREEQQVRCDGLLALLQALEQSGLADQVTRIDMTSSARILMELGERFTVRLPVHGDFVYLLGAMSKAVDTLEPYEKGTLDLTVKDYTVIFSPE